ncbi:MAG: hypothetical protein JW827_06165 [Spirochaetes bacterium]|nr:hypothetical protein [Spirochaetota bacterium]
MKEQSIILFRCRDALHLKMKKLVDNTKKLYRLQKIDELRELLKEKKNVIVIYDHKNRKNFSESAKPLKKSARFLTVFIMTKTDMQKLKSGKEEDVYYTAMTSSTELHQLLNILFSINQMQIDLDEKENIVKAFETASELSRKELLEAYENIQAREIVSEMSRNELMDTLKSVKAWERVAELSREERIATKQEIEAFNEVLELSREERVLADKIIGAWEKAMEMGRGELIEAYEKLNQIIKEKNELVKKLMSKVPNPKQKESQ